jgi:hypothetical protein
MTTVTWDVVVSPGRSLFINSVACIGSSAHKFVLAIWRVKRVKLNIHFNFSTGWLKKEYGTIKPKDFIETGRGFTYQIEKGVRTYEIKIRKEKERKERRKI